MEAKRGDRVHINPMKRLYFFQEGEGGIRLSVGGEEMVLIPKDATDQHLAQINAAIRAGHLGIGWANVRLENLTEDDTDIKEVLKLGRKRIGKWLETLISDRTIDDSVKIKKLESLLSMEKAGRKRPDVIRITERQFKYVGGVTEVEDSDQEKIVINLTTGNGEEDTQQQEQK